MTCRKKKIVKRKNKFKIEFQDNPILKVKVKNIEKKKNLE